MGTEPRPASISDDTIASDNAVIIINMFSTLCSSIGPRVLNSIAREMPRLTRAWRKCIEERKGNFTL